jgi:hypothetical protein
MDGEIRSILREHVRLTVDVDTLDADGDEREPHARA